MKENDTHHFRAQATLEFALVLPLMSYLGVVAGGGGGVDYGTYNVRLVPLGY